MAGVTRQAVGNWRDRFGDFPEPVAELGQGPVFDARAVNAWLEEKGKLDPKRGNGMPLGFENTLWAAADKLRGNLEPAEYKHVVLGLVFLKYISDAFEERRTQL